MRHVLTTIGNIDEAYPERGLEFRKLPRVRRRLLLRQLVSLAPKFDGALLFGGAGFNEGYVDVVAACVIGRRGRPVVLTECYWETSSRSLARLRGRATTNERDLAPASSGKLARRVISTLDSDHTHYCVLSRHEEASFPKVWNLAPSRVHFTAHGYPFDDETQDVVDGQTVFAGGNSLRDYRALIEVAPSVPAPVVIATSLTERDEGPKLRVGPLSQDAYRRALRSSRIVVVPLLTNTLRSAGQQTYLGAMRLRKPVVVTDSPGVRDYIRDRETGIIVPPNDPRELAEALRWLLDDSNQAEVSAMVERAYVDVTTRFTLEAYHTRVLDVVESALDEPSGARKTR